MISLEQVQLLEEKVSKAIEYVQKVTEEKAALESEKAALISKLETNQKRIDELEVHVLRFKEEQGRIEDGIIAALDRLSQFEEAFENSLKDKPDVEKVPAKPTKSAVSQDEAELQEKSSAAKNDDAEEPVNKEFFEIVEDVDEPLPIEAELDIF